MTNLTLTDVPGIKVGHATDLEGATGCTAILCPPETIGGVDVRGGAPGTRETDLLAPHNMVEEVHAVMLAGGSAFGLAAADGAMRYLVEHNTGYPTSSGAIVPIVPSAILYDLSIGEGDVRPDAAMGYAACDNATAQPVTEGTVGAGTGAIVGGMLGPTQATKGGIGSAGVDLGGGLIVSALMAVNAIGDVIGEDGHVIAGLRGPNGEFIGTLQAMRDMARVQLPDSSNTVIGVVATNARLNKAQAQKVAQMAHDGLARAINPAHTLYDGDTIFTLATGSIPANPSVIGAYAAATVAHAIRRAIMQATSLAGVRALND